MKVKPPNLHGNMSNEEYCRAFDAIIAQVEQTQEHEWIMGVCRSKDQTQNCLLGHVFNMGSDKRESNQWITFLEECIATQYMFFPVNDGTDPRYPQTTPKQRCLAYLRDLRAGREKTTLQMWEEG